MEPNIAPRFCSLSVAALFTFVLLSPRIGVAEPGAGTGTKGRETPQALVETYNDAVARKDWKTCFLCYDAKWRADFMGGLFYGIGMSGDESLKAIVKKHAGEKLADADEIAIPAVRSDTRMFKELRMFEKLQKQFRDLPAFVDEISARLDAMEQAPFQKLGDVKDIRVEGDVAVGHGKQNLPPPLDLPVLIHFCRIDGRWYLTIADPPPPLSVAARSAQLQAEVETLWVLLCCSGPAGGKEHHEVRMSVQPFVYESNKPTLHLVRLSEVQAKKLIKYLETDGFLEKAVELGKQEVPDRDRGPHTYCYTLQVSTTNLQPTEDLGLKLHEDLGWVPGLVKRLEGLRGVLDEDGARALDAILAEITDEDTKNGVR
jgi:hypothetical protein